MKRFLLVAACICALAAVSPVTPSGAGYSHPFATVAFAGHTATNGYCEDGTWGCLPGDPLSRAAGKVKRANKPVADSKQSPSGSALAPGASILALVLLIWLGFLL